MYRFKTKDKLEVLVEIFNSHFLDIIGKLPRPPTKYISKSINLEQDISTSQSINKNCKNNPTSPKS